MGRPKEHEVLTVTKTVEAGHGESAICPRCGSVLPVNEQPDECPTCHVGLDYDK